MGWSDTPGPSAPYELLDDGFAPDPCDLLVVGCGNILRGDDAVGPVLVRHLVEAGLPDGVRVVDGGTAGMDVAFAMRGARRVVIVDAAATGAEPGTTYRVPAEQLSELPPVDGLHSHNLRWDHALSFGSWLLGPHRPTDVTVYLVEGESYEPGAELSPRVEEAMHAVAGLIRREHLSAPETVEVTEDGYLHVPAALAARYFPGDVLLARLDETPEPALVLVPVRSAEHGGLVLKQSTAAGDRSVLVLEVFDFAPAVGTFEVRWDEERGLLVVPLGAAAVPEGEPDGHRGDDAGGARAGPVGGLPPGHLTRRGGTPARRGAPERADRAGAGRHRGADGGPPPGAEGGGR
jgi:hydrogenase maturation protease